ncbi:MAG TPA: hypothetical protein VFR10_12625 [bacterium]|nr:hypothetical protein [bacterium]
MRDIRATFLDENGNPIVGALLYAEAVTSEGPYSFVSATSGQAGEVPQIAIRALKIPWQRGARLSLAGFAPGRRPVVLHDPARSVPSDGVSFTLLPALGPADLWNPDLFLLEFPFVGNSRLAQEVLQPQFSDLRAAFRLSYEARPSQDHPSARELEKISAIQSLP